MAQVRGLGPRVGGPRALFCIHRVNRVYGALVVTSWTCYDRIRRLINNCRIIIVIIFYYNLPIYALSDNVVTVVVVFEVFTARQHSLLCRALY